MLPRRASRGVHQARFVSRAFPYAPSPFLAQLPYGQRFN